MRAQALGETEVDLIDLTAGRSWLRSDHAPLPTGVTQIQMDLGLRFPLHSVRIAGDMAGPRPGLALSDDGEVWREPVLDAVPACTGATALTLAPGEGAWARHVRVTATGAQGQVVRILCAQADFDLIVLRRVLDVPFDMADERPGANPYVSYRLVSAERPRSRALVGLALYECGAFGNCLIQLLLAIGIARNLNLKYIKLPAADRSEVIGLTGPLTCGGLTFIPGSEPLPEAGAFLSGMYFDLGIQQLAGPLGPDETRDIVRTCIRPLFNRLPRDIPAKPDDELLIHIRSGDIFSTWVAPTYPQPPLAFYQMVIRRLLTEGRIARIKMVFENRLNPVIPVLEAWITALGVPLTTQSGTLIDDVTALMNGRYLVFGLGTFGPGVCQLSEHVEQVFYFASGWPQHFKSIPTIGRVIEVLDVAGGYTKVGEWDNSPERRALMLEYPAEKLAFDDA
ncbi:coagulation factor 5 8 type domain-containing protein [Methylobacterium sp. P1-11]|uniref:coagulation factor 5 8 type domain-containing protein n=1 Tax=Methylobacterium sp. P1-11 TaxID=2024616 RepID=UPI0011EF5C70|nr:coagulation factor 5 8 type domain-containing protein [Methylobacterium sp. P1-11]KAA0113777.1 coagulation factor 5 8 type domain-containing protein [Methylobacterium sp. P1-11]